MATKNWAAAYEEAGDVGPLPDGEYPFVVQTAEHKVSQNGKDMYSIKALVETGPYAKRAVWHNFVVSLDSSNAMGVFFRFIGALGLDKAFFASNPSDEAIVARLKNARFQGVVATRTWQGQDRNEFKVIKPPKGMDGAPPMPASAPTPPAPPAPPAAAPAPSAPPAAPNLTAVPPTPEPPAAPPANAPF